MGFCGTWLYGLWTGKAMTLSHELLWLFLLPIPFNALWYTSSVIHVASNKHEVLAVRYVVATVLNLVACWGLSSVWGINGAALSTLVVDLMLIPYVLRQSVRLTQDEFSTFLPGMVAELRGITGFLKTRKLSGSSSPS
jgi:O-antigen/teichoic acid export membrane protein